MIRLGDVAKFVRDDVINSIHWRFNQTTIQQEPGTGMLIATEN